MNLWQSTPYTLPLVAAALVSAALALYILQRFVRRPPAAPGALELSCLLLGVTWWTAASAAEMASTQLAHKIFWANLSYVGIGAVPACWLLFSIQYSASSLSLLRGRRVAWLALEPALTLLIVFTNDAHGWYRASSSLTPAAGGFDVLTVTLGPWFWLHAIYSYIVLLAASLLLIGWVRRAPALYRGQMLTILVAGIAPWAANALYLSGRSPLPLLDLTPFGFTVTGLAVAWGLFRYNLLDVVPVGRDAVIEDLEDSILILDLEGRLADLNPAACQLLRVRRDHAIGRGAAEICRRIPALAEWVTTDGSRAQLETAEAPPSTWEARRSPLHRAGRTTGTLILLRDVTDQRRQQQSQVQVQRLRAAGELALGVSHNLNNLLTGITGPVGLALSVCDDECLRPHLEQIRDSARRAADLVNRLGQAVRGEDAPGIEAVDVAVIIDDAIQAARPRWQDEARASGRMIELIRHVDDDLPMVTATRTELLDVLLNLILNAVDAMPEGGELTLTAQSQPHGLEVRVCDTGIGMTEEIRQRVFDPFFTTKADVGTGLGLSTARSSVKGWGGRLEVYSQVGHGAEFCLWLPAWEGEPASVTSAAAQIADQAPDPGPGQPLRTLIVEDEGIVALLLSSCMEEAGHTVTVYHDGARAMEEMDDAVFDLAFLDLSLPGAPGDGVARMLRGRNPTMALALVTGWDLAEEDPRREPFDFYLRKPFDVPDVVRISKEAQKLIRARGD